MTRLVTFSVQTADDAFDLIALVNDKMPTATFTKVSKMLTRSDKPTKKRSKNGKRMSDSTAFPNTRRRWTAEEDEMVAKPSDEEFSDLAFRNDLAEVLGRTRNSIEVRRWRLREDGRL